MKKSAFTKPSLLITVATSLLTTMAFAQNSATTTTAAPAAQQTSTVAKPVENAPLGRFGLSLVLDTSVSPEALRNLSDANIGSGDKTAESINLVGLSYKLSETDKVAVKQYWNQKYGPKADSAPETSWSVLTYSTKTKGILGSDEIAPLFWYYVPTSANVGLDNGIPGEQIDHNGILRADVEVGWTLNPKWSVSYYFNPRQSIVPGEQKTWKANPTGSVKFPGRGNYDLAGVATTKTTLIHYAILYYNMTDKLQGYGFVGFRNEFLTNEGMYNSKNGGLPALGLNYNMNKNFNLNFEINQEVPLSATTYTQDSSGKLAKTTSQIDSTWLDGHDLNYELVMAFSL